LIRLVLADDHPILLSGVELLFRQEPDFEVAARCTSGEEALRAVRLHRPDVLVIDFKMPGRDGLSVVREIKHERPDLGVIVLTAALAESEVLEAVRLGIQGIVLKETAPHVLVKAVREVHAGGQWLDQRAASRALATMLKRSEGERDLAAVLTQREIEIVRRVATGLRNKEIARELSIAEGTVKIHLHNIYEKLKVGSRLELTLHAQSKGLV
jgi:DNA-binding NarL/FixJ family response regulator